MSSSRSRPARTLDPQPALAPRPDYAGLADLLARVEAGDGSDRALDADILWEVGLHENLKRTFGGVRHVRSGWMRGVGDTYAPYGERFEQSGGPFHYSSSVDDALALVAQKLPGWTYGVDASAPECGIDVDLFPVQRRDMRDDVRGTGSTLPLAILAALLAALIVKFGASALETSAQGASEAQHREEPNS